MKLTEQQIDVQKYLDQALSAAREARKGAFQYGKKYSAKPHSSANLAENKKTETELS